jgi:hypothetical protein
MRGSEERPHLTTIGVGDIADALSNLQPTSRASEPEMATEATPQPSSRASTLGSTSSSRQRITGAGKPERSRCPAFPIYSLLR